MIDLFGAINIVAQGVVNNGIKTVINQYNTLTSSNIQSFMNNGANNILDAIGVQNMVRSPTSNALTGVITQGVASANSMFKKIITDEFLLRDLSAYNNYNNNQIISNSTTPGFQNQNNGFGSINSTYPLNDSPATHMNVLTDTVKQSMIDDTNTLVNSTNNAILANYQKVLAPNTAAVPSASNTTKERSYAMDLDKYFPKYNFLYIVKINMNSDYSDVPTSFTFVVKKIDRPNIQVQSELINFYNFRTPVQTKTELSPINMVFYDDNQGETLSFFVKYLNKISPITTQSNQSAFETNGLTFDNSLTSSIRITSANVTAAIATIDLYHIYDYGGKVDKYTFFKPQISKFNLSDLDMSDGTNLSDVVMEFVYDNINIENGISSTIIDELGSPSCLMNLKSSASIR